MFQNHFLPSAKMKKIKKLNHYYNILQILYTIFSHFFSNIYRCKSGILNVSNKITYYCNVKNTITRIFKI